MPARRVWIEISDDDDENYEYPDSAGIDDEESETFSETSMNEDADSNEQDSCDETSSSGSENSDSHIDDLDLDQEVAELQDGMPESSDDDEEEDSLEPDDTLADDTIELRKSLQALQTKEALRIGYPPEFWASTPIPYVDEGSALDDLMLAAGNDAPMDIDPTDDFPDFIATELDDFYVYRSRRHPHRGGFQGQYERLDIVASEPGHHHWVFSGVVKDRKQQKQRITGYVHGISIRNIADLSAHTTAGAIWLRSEIGEWKDCWYQLQEPYSGYRMFWVDFLWLSDFGKLFNDYLHESSKLNKLVTLRDFRSNFWTQIQEWHGAALNSWYRQRQRDPKQTRKPLDLRKDVALYKDFLRHLVFTSRGDTESQRRHPVWDEIVAFEVDPQSTSKEEKTVVTRNVARCFQETFSHWQKKFQLLEVVDISPQVEIFRESRRRHYGFPDKLSNQNAGFSGDSDSDSKISLVDHLLEKAGIQNSRQVRLYGALKNKVVIVRVDNDKRNEVDFCYAWVRETISPTKIRVVWLVRPFETLCGDGFYPRGNELFFSSRCNCEPVSIHDVVETINASIFSGQVTDDTKLFVHGLFNEAQQVHLTADPTNVVCHCQDESYEDPREAAKQYLPHDSSQNTLPKLKALSLFSGAGLLAWSMARSGYIQTVVAIEQSKLAAATFKANDELDQVEVKHASVNPCLAADLQSNKSLKNFDLIDAGTSCKGFSLLNALQSSKNSQQQQSLLANTLSWFELYLPIYGIIENVPNMDSGSPGLNPCEQAICVLVALGYQVRKMTITASTLGGASSRKRLIIMVAAPYAELPDDVAETHSEMGMPRTRTCKDVISGLSPIKNDTTLNIADPYHVPLHRFGINWSKGVNLRDVVERIPSEPPGLGLAQTAGMGLLSRSQKTWFQGLTDWQRDPKKKTLRRINRNKPFHTMTTHIDPLDAKHSGQFLHYEQHRTISSKEAGMAMDTPNDFLIMGTIKQHYKQQGNGVAWSRPELASPPTEKKIVSYSTTNVTPSNVPSPHYMQRAAPISAESTATPPALHKAVDIGYKNSTLRTSRKRQRPAYVDEDDSDIEFIGSTPVRKQVDQKRRDG
ncbi:hypothetical protein LTR84_009363 [Exophiala bonariae]|uniref:DNA (cytosine-5-)-methyltransferase n=1 Tax=Exophiala bonariae TaxID=1690606 RepID=A0AAV9MY36_9EURO|nr:hypothetical protein LTR84_009363 [Exophiala bonariae]